MTTMNPPMKIIICGKSGAGKDHLKGLLGKCEGYRLSVSYTTRSKREGEVDGKSYHFVTDEQFDEIDKTSSFLEKDIFNGWKYGTSAALWDSSDVFIMTPGGINQLDEKKRNQALVIYLDIDDILRENRVQKRCKKESDIAEMRRRIVTDKKDFESFSNFDVRVRNPRFTIDQILVLYNTLLDLHNRVQYLEHD